MQCLSSFPVATLKTRPTLLVFYRLLPFVWNLCASVTHKLHFMLFYCPELFPLCHWRSNKTYIDRPGFQKGQIKRKKSRNGKSQIQLSANVCFITKIKYKWWPNEYTADFLLKPKHFYLSFSAFFPFPTLLILACLKLSGKNVERVSSVFVNACFLLKLGCSSFWQKQKRKKKIHIAQPWHLHLFGIIYGWESRVYKLTGKKNNKKSHW